MTITFEYEGRKYLLPKDADEKRHIVLPDGRVFHVGWEETDPPEPVDFEEVRSLFAGVSADLETLVRMYDATLAQASG